MSENLSGNSKVEKSSQRSFFGVTLHGVLIRFRASGAPITLTVGFKGSYYIHDTSGVRRGIPLVVRRKKYVPVTNGHNS